MITLNIVANLLQHGAFECLLDTVEACAIDAWPKLVSTLMRFDCDLFVW